MPDVIRAKSIDSHGRLLLSVREAAAELGVSRAYMYQLLRPLGPVPWVKLGRLRKIRREELEAYVATLPDCVDPRAASAHGS